MKITATVITLNEETNLGEALASLKWADEIVVIDSNSTDRTLEIARQFTDRVYTNEWAGYSAQKNFAAGKASHDWIFNLDADERISESLAAKLAELTRSESTDCAGFEMPRLTRYLGRWIRHSGWYPDYKLRLYDRRSGEWVGNYVHESVRVNGKVGQLSGDILHYSLRDASEHQLRMDRYTTLAASEQFEKGKRASIISLAYLPALAFLRSYFLKAGFLDGLQGLAISYFAGHYVFLKTLKLWELNRSGDCNDHSKSHP